MPKKILRLLIMKDLTGQWLDLMKTLLATSTTTDSWSTSSWMCTCTDTSPSRLSKKTCFIWFYCFRNGNLSVSSDNAACTYEKFVNLLSNAAVQLIIFSTILLWVISLTHTKLIITRKQHVIFGSSTLVNSRKYSSNCSITS